ncbi:uncharacterized protein [Nicotiana sylvestris]|uniref:uncharacterized protein n=1 Tax=Nicotiana sylvestris TaxID=4096 RepID=UPI00388C493A
MVRRNGEFLKRGSSSKPKNYDHYHKCGKFGHFIKNCPLLKQEFSKNNPKKAAKRNPFPSKDFKRKRSAHNVMKQALTAWGDSSGESEDETDAGDSSVMAVACEQNEYDSTFDLMSQSDNNKNDDNKEVDFRDVRRNLKSYSPKKLMSLASVLIDVYHSLVEDRDSLTVELGEAEQTRDDLVAVVIDHRETIEKFKEDRNDFLAVIADLRETIERPRTKSKHGNSGKPKEIASVEHIRLENELKAVRIRMCAEIEKNRNLQADLERVKNDLEKFLKWTWSSEAITAIYTNNGGYRQGLGFQREKTPYNPHNKYVTISDNWLCTHCGNNGHVKENCLARVQSVQKNKGTIKGNGQQWFMDNGCSKHMTGNTMDFLSLKALQGGSICDKENKVEFLSKMCIVTDLITGEVVLVAKRYKNIYVANFKSLQSSDMSCLKAVDDEDEMWHRRLGHTSFSLLNKLI